MSDPTSTSQVRDASAELARFVEEHSGAITNALGNQARHMGEAADLARQQGQIPYAKVFLAESSKTAGLLTELEALLERLAEARQDEFVDSAD